MQVSSSDSLAFNFSCVKLLLLRRPPWLSSAVSNENILQPTVYRSSFLKLILRKHSPLEACRHKNNNPTFYYPEILCYFKNFLIVNAQLYHNGEACEYLKQNENSTFTFIHYANRMSGNISKVNTINI